MISYSDLCLLNCDIEDNIQKLISYGADSIELMMDGQYWCDTESTICNLSQILNKYKVEFSIHPPTWNTNLTSENKLISETTFNEHKKAILFAKAINAKYIVIHPGFYYSSAFGKENTKKRAYELVSRLNKMAKQLGIKLAVENVGCNGDSLFTQEEYIKFIENVDDNIGYLIDTGHAHINKWNIPELIEKTEDRLIALHLHDNFGEADEHNPIGQGSIDWESIFKVLKNTSLNFKLVFEYKTGTEGSIMRKHKDMLLDCLGRVK
ncbi:sugar phosphate isomerase/epimerase [Clostridium sp. OS1-26]|uniref:sugar phosphate isomerase/epimerase family protein n=1 Tax=Clostridium sp. OS1-26 TaxID=3070681 RepID=UPI0027E17FF5|nr:sugar phosphate isomerase/epimerase [Clostridium sp. OS1-26]WML34812.1 sugar phosphate isomerase/epimerase [Clostridium sp. OS1-26]